MFAPEGDRSARLIALLALGLALLLAGCATTMKVQPKYLPDSYSEFYPSHTAAQAPPANTVARGQVISDTALLTGKVNGQPMNDFPFLLTRDDLLRGQSLFNGICAPCHDRVGNGNGVVVQRGFTKPPSLQADNIRTMPPGQLFDVISNGFGVMPPYSPILQVPDRWRVIGYLRALELSQNARIGDVPPDLQNQIKSGP